MKPLVKFCVICGKAFLARNIRRKTCSEECRKDWNAQRDYALFRKIQSRLARIVPHPFPYKGTPHSRMDEVRKCLLCGKEFHPLTVHQKYCTGSCRREAKRRRLHGKNH